MVELKKPSSMTRHPTKSHFFFMQNSRNLFTGCKLPILEGHEYCWSGDRKACLSYNFRKSKSSSRCQWRQLGNSTNHAQWETLYNSKSSPSSIWVLAISLFALSMAKTKWICHLLLRFFAFATTLSAAIIMATSHEKTRVLAFTFEAKYSHTPAFVYFVVANAIVSVYGFFVLFLPSESSLWGLIVALDMICTIFLSSSISAALAIAQVGKKGNSYAGWLAVCGQVPKYCNQVTGALAIDFIAVIIYVIFLLYSIHNFLDPLLLRKT